MAGRREEVEGGGGGFRERKGEMEERRKAEVMFGGVTGRLILPLGASKIENFEWDFEVVSRFSVFSNESGTHHEILHRGNQFEINVRICGLIS